MVVLRCGILVVHVTLGGTYLFTLQVTLDEINSLAPFILRRPSVLQSPKKLKPTIIIFIEVEIVDGVKGFVCSVVVRLVGMIKFSALVTTSQFCGVG